MSDAAFDLSSTHVHLGLGARAKPLHDFEWTPEYLARYAATYASDGDEGRLVTMGEQSADWDSWERHPAGEEVVLQISGRVVLIQNIDGAQVRTELRSGQAIINPANVWHTVDVLEAGDALFITPGQGTEHKPR